MSRIKLPSKKTKIVCTIGPSSGDVQTLQQMIAKGMNVARINFAHGSFDAHREHIANIRSAAEAVGQPVAIMGDLPGPKMRIGRLETEPITLHRGDPFILQTGDIVGNHERVSMDFEGLVEAVHPGDHIFMNDGYIQLLVEKVIEQEVHCTIHVGGELRSYKGVNFPGINLGISAFTSRDAELLRFAEEEHLDAVSQSFVQGPEDILQVREAAAAMDYNPFIIAKIERAGAFANIQAILDVVDGIMVARGDLGVEIPIEEIPSTQKKLIRQANLKGKPVITATQMLESMTTNRRPTRAEVTDVANAILDGTDAVMLSGETAVGDYPIDTVAIMARVAQVTEENHTGEYGIGDLLEKESAENLEIVGDLVSANIYRLAKSIDPAVVFVPSLSGSTARRVTRFRLPQWIIAPSRDGDTCHKLMFSYGVFPLYVQARSPVASASERKSYTRHWLETYAEKGERVIVIEGSGILHSQDTRRIDVIDVR